MTVTTQTITVADILEHAADILEEFDWHQGSAGSREEGTMCAVGAIMESLADYIGHWWDGGRDLYIGACGINGHAPHDAGIWPLAAWNDQPGRTCNSEVAFGHARAAEGAAGSDVSKLTCRDEEVSDA